MEATGKLWARVATVLLLCLGCAVSAAHAQISPGPLSHAHAFLSGTKNCLTCHRIAGVKDFKCLDCHREIATRINEGRGFHAAMVSKSEPGKACSTCHHEHYGEDSPLVVWKPSRAQFDHKQTGFPLQGRHLQLECAKCHTPSHQIAADASLIQMKDRNRTFLGLRRECSNCHVEPHQGKFGVNCASCHSFDSWKTMPQFDHAKTGFTLVGSHLKLACEKCHVAGPEGKQKWAGLSADGCDSCHKSPHPATFTKGAACDNCHTPAGWHSLVMAALKARFDHSKTHFSLAGKHSSLACEKCHTQTFRKPTAFEHCSDCHHPSPHGDQLNARADKGECSACHTVEGFKPAKFALAEHATTHFPLVGKHESLDCAKCHRPTGATSVQFRLKYSRCDDCHRDQHSNQFNRPPYMNHCNICHAVTGFKPALFTVDRHKSTDFALAGAHATTACGDCHRKPNPSGKGEVLQFHFEDQTCTACHRDPHGGRFSTVMVKLGSDQKALGCVACHTVDSWKVTSAFDHAQTGFDIVGAHTMTGCADCHKPRASGAKLLRSKFYTAPERCDSCHADVHAGQFGTDPDCASCHTSVKWTPSTFNHDRQSSFRLEGEHRMVRCARCHTTTKAIDGKKVIVYKPTATECASCHPSGVKPLSAVVAE